MRRKVLFDLEVDLPVHLHEVEKTSENGELCNVYMKELTVKLRIYQKFAAFFSKFSQSTSCSFSRKIRGAQMPNLPSILEVAEYY